MDNEHTHNLASRIRSGLSGLAILRFLALALSMLASIIVARALGPTAFGQLAVILAFAAILSIPSNNTAIPLLLRFTSTYDKPANYDQLNDLWRWVQQRSRKWTFAGTIVLLLISGYYASRGSWPETTLYTTAALLIPCWALAAHAAGVLQGLRRVVLAQAFDWFIQPALYLTCVIVLVLNTRMSLQTVLFSVVVATAVSAAIGYLTMRWEQNKRTSPGSDRRQVTQWRESWRTYLNIQAVIVANLKIPLITLGIMSNESEAGVYRASESIATLLAIVMVIANGVMGPYVARMHDDQNLAELQTLMQRTARLLFLLCLPVVAALLLFGDQLILLIYGGAFSGAYVPLLILIVGQLITMACGSVALLLNMTGHERHVSRSLGWAFVTSIVLCAALAPWFGAIGAATAVTVGIVQWNVVQLALAKRHVGINPSILPSALIAR